MIILEESAHLEAPPEALAAFLEALDHRYRDWHPDHVLFRWDDPPGARPRRFFFDERIGGRRIAMHMTMEPGAGGLTARCRPLRRTTRWVVPWMTFAAIPEPGGCRYLHRIAVRGRWLKPVLDRLILDAVRRHMREEAVNLQRLITVP
ncbi:MAG: SRPBCC family protein [Bauldia sp.]|nr:SRPBCC family protein [Bauldia sp.]